MTHVHEDNEVELQSLDSYAPNTEEPTTATSLPSADGGFAAWRFLIVAFIFEALLWGQL